MKSKLRHEHRHMLHLIVKDQGEDGWTPVSDAVYPHIFAIMPRELVIFDGSPGSYTAKLTDEGQSIVRAMEWL